MSNPDRAKPGHLSSGGPFLAPKVPTANSKARRAAIRKYEEQNSKPIQLNWTSRGKA